MNSGQYYSQYFARITFIGFRIEAQHRKIDDGFTVTNFIPPITTCQFAWRIFWDEYRNIF